MYTERNEGKIVGLINSFTGGGAERQMAFLLEQGLVDKVYTLQPERAYDIEGEIIPLSQRFANVPRFLRFFAIPVYALLLSRHISRGDTVISFTERSNFVNIVAKLFKSHRTIVSVRTNPKRAYRGIKKVIGYMARVLYCRADMVVANSIGARDYLHVAYGIPIERLSVVYNGLDRNRIANLAEEPITPEHESIFAAGPVCVVVGRFEIPKGQAHAIRAFKRVVEKIPNAQLLLLGEGSMENILDNLILQLDLKASVHRIGFQKNPFAYMHRAAITLLPSLWEGMPNVVLESIATGTPVVATDCDFGPREILDPTFRGNINTMHVTSCGILTPTFGNIDLNVALTPSEIVFADAVVAALQNKDRFLDIEKSIDDILAPFASTIVLNAWKRVLVGSYAN